jgi:hypothetical protein
MAQLLGENEGAPAPAPAPAPISVGELRRARAETSATGSGSVAAQTAVWREQARQQREDTLGYDPELARFAWGNVSLSDLRDIDHPLARRMEETGESQAHSESNCFLCQYTVAAIAPGEIDVNAVAWETDARQGLSVLLGMCGDEMSREQAITALIDYYDAMVVGPLQAAGQQVMPLTREICRGHIDDVVLNPKAQRKMTVKRIEKFERIMEHTAMRYNSVTRQCVPDVKILNAFSRLVTTKDQLMARIEMDEAMARQGSDASKRVGGPVAPTRFVRSGIPAQALGNRRQTSNPTYFPGTR